jgi:uncharacterized membrane protein YedE/YeeE
MTRKNKNRRGTADKVLCAFRRIAPYRASSKHFDDKPRDCYSLRGNMKMPHFFLATVASFLFGTGLANAAGCVEGAAVGGVAGHVAGHHAVAGAAIGCAVGHHQAKVKAKKEAAAQAGAAANNATTSKGPNNTVAPNAK